MLSMPDAGRFLDLLAGDEPVTFQTFDDSRVKRKPLNKVLHGALDKHGDTLQSLNGRGAGVFVMVNAGDLKGRKVGVEIGTVGHFSLLKILELAHLTHDDVTIVSIPAWEIQQNMIDGVIDAGVTWEPYLTSSAQEGQGNIIITSRDYPESIVTAMVFDAETVAQRPEDVQKIVAAYFDAVQYIEQNPTEAYQLMGQAENISPAEFASHVEGLRYLNRQKNIEAFGVAANGPAYQTAAALAQFLADKGVITHAPEVNQLLDPQFVTKPQ